jgi:toxin CcdB
LQARQYDIVELQDGSRSIVIQNDLLDGIDSRVVVPLLPPETAGAPMPPLNPLLTFGTVQFKLMPQMMHAVPTDRIRARIGTAVWFRDEIREAMSAFLDGV